MYESGQSEGRAELRNALLRLEDAVARHEAQLAGTSPHDRDPSLQVLLRSVALMRQEAERLRRVLGA